MRKLIKLVLFYSLSFAVLFLISTCLRFLALRVGWIRALSRDQEAVLVEIINAARWALSLGIYGGVLIGMSYAIRKQIFAPVAILFIGAMTLVFTVGIDELLKNWERVPPAGTQNRPLGGPGLMLYHSVRPAGTVIVLLEGPAQPVGKRVLVTPGKPFVYQEELGTREAALVSLPPAPFQDDTPWILKSLSIDLRLNSLILRERLNLGVLPFVLYAGTLIYLLSSLMFVFKISMWPLADLFLGCLAFRGVLALEIFLNTAEMQAAFDSFFQKRLPLLLVVPLIFFAVGFLIHLYSFLVFLSKKRSEYGD